MRLHRIDAIALMLPNAIAPRASHSHCAVDCDDLSIHRISARSKTAIICFSLLVFIFHGTQQTNMEHIAQTSYQFNRSRLLFRIIRVLSVSVPVQFLRVAVSMPATLKLRSIAADVAGIVNMCGASRARLGAFCDKSPSHFSISMRCHKLCASFANTQGDALRMLRHRKRRAR